MPHTLLTRLTLPTSNQVPPGEAEGFVDTWKDAAEKTIKEEGNRMYG